MIPPPIALGLYLCEKVIIEERTKNITLVNCFTRLVVDDLALPPRFVVYSALTDGLGNAILQLVGTRLDTDQVVYQRQYPIQFLDRIQELRAYLRVNQCVFPAPGRYQFTLFIDGDWIAQRQLSIVVKEQ